MRITEGQPAFWRGHEGLFRIPLFFRGLLLCLGKGPEAMVEPQGTLLVVSPLLSVAVLVLQVQPGV